MSLSAVSEAESTAPGCNRLAQLPDELWDAIIEVSEDAAFWPEDRLKQLQYCSLVCKRWHRIVRPRLFYTLCFSVYDTEGAANVPRRTQFYTKNPIIASLMHTVELEIQAEVTFGELDQLLGALTSLRCLTVMYGFLLGEIDEDSQDQPLRSASHKLKKLVYKDGYRDPWSQCATFVNLLALFSDIGELHTHVVDSSAMEDEYPSEEDVDEAIARTLNAPQRTQEAFAALIELPTGIRKLLCDGGYVGGFFVPSYLFKLGVVSKLTHFALILSGDFEWTQSLNIMSTCHRTLTNLRIEISTFTEEEMNYGISTLRRVLSTLSFLEDISITLLLPNPKETAQTCARASTRRSLMHVYASHRPHWLALIHSLQSIPPLAPLRRIKIALRGVCPDPHILDWRQFAAWCLSRIESPFESKAPDQELKLKVNQSLKEIEVEFWQVYEQKECVEYEMRDVTEKLKACSGVFVNSVDWTDLNGAVLFVEWQWVPGLQIVEYDCRDKGCQNYRACNQLIE